MAQNKRIEEVYIIRPSGLHFWSEERIPEYTNNHSIHRSQSIASVIVPELILEASHKVNTTYLLGCWLRILSDDGLNLWLLGALVYLTLFGMTPLKTVELWTECLDNLQGIYNPFVRVRSVWFATSTRQVIEFWSYPVSEILPTFGLLTSYFVWWWFALVIVEHARLPYLVWYRHFWKQLMRKLNI